MPAGTIALTNNSATVTGAGTSFTTELKINDFLTSNVGGVLYTLGVKSIESNTSLTLMENFTGPSASGQSWTPVPYGTMAAITAQVAAQVTYAIRGFNLDKVNWQQIFTGTGKVTVTLPDGTSWQGPAWGGITELINKKANLVDDVVEVAHGGTGQKTLSGVMTWLGLGDAAFKNTGTASGTLAAGNDSRITGAYQKAGGTVVGTYIIGNPTAYFSNNASARYSIGNVTYLDIARFLMPDIGVGPQLNFQVVANPGSYLSLELAVGNGFHSFRHSGQIITTAGTVQISASDGRIKTKKGKPPESALERIMALAKNATQDYQWLNYREDINAYFYDQPQRGFIAQDAWAVDKTYASKPEVGADSEMPESGDQIWGLNTNAILADAVLAIQEVQAQAAAEIHGLKERMKAIDGLDG